MSYKLVLFSLCIISSIYFFVGVGDQNEIKKKQEKSTVIESKGENSSENSKALNHRKDKVLLKGKYLELVGGFEIPRVAIGNKHTKAFYFDLLPNSNRWVSGHEKKHLVFYQEPVGFYSKDPADWPALEVIRTVPVMEQSKKISPTGVLWLDEFNVLASGRKHYRSGYEKNWLINYNLTTGKETRFDIDSANDESYKPFQILQALGGGFIRLHDDELKSKLADGNGFLLGRGGYDTLGSPLGPAIGAWDKKSSSVEFLLHYPREFPATRDSYYFFPNKDPKTYSKARLPIWKFPNKEHGYWIAGDVGGITQINHPQVKGILVTKNQARGLMDYRAQGDSGSGRFFLVANPMEFYGAQGKGNRGNHRQETLNQNYAEGTYGRLGLVIAPQQLVEVKQGVRKVHDVTFSEFEWPQMHIPWVESARVPTFLSSVTWDDARQLLWLSVGTRKKRYLVAYKIVVDENRPSERKNLPLYIE
ncbi:hypothetical protein [Thalassotalea eurytherma]|uniref:DUF4861 domain-containing protein n=1 Tax=Thalassotalea eurytherma TaxID=1144278 RepID=A0ABQ6H1L9_9GAMM|nr:hypothetical protein [Thalassotalea eurytherma]GLX82098.1 hypothetical protein theurythT_15500 [Thalassotalea eurytherma]